MSIDRFSGWRFTGGLRALLAAAVIGLSGCAGPYVYVVNHGDDDVSQYRDGGGGRLAPISPPRVGAGPGPSAIALSPDGKYAYVVNQDVTNGEGGLAQYSVDGIGSLSPKSPAAVDTGFTPGEVAVSGDGENVYVTNFGGDSLSQYGVDSNGGLHPLSPAEIGAGTRPGAVTVSPSGRSVYVANSTGDQPGVILRFAVGTDGALTDAFESVATGSFPNDIEISPDGGSAYVSSGGDRTVFQYDIDSADRLQPKSPPFAGALSTPGGLAASPDGQSLYVADFGDNSVAQFDVGAGGALQPKDPLKVPAGSGSSDLVVSADGKSVYVTNRNDDNISQYSVGTGGKLQSKTPATVATGLTPSGIAASPLAAQPAGR